MTPDTSREGTVRSTARMCPTYPSETISKVTGYSLRNRQVRQLFKLGVRPFPHLYRPHSRSHRKFSIEPVLRPPVLLSSLRLVISTVMLAAKYIDDFFYKNDYYAKVGGISRTEINVLEQ